MANELGFFDVPLFALKGLTILMNSLGTPKRVNRSYEGERKAFGVGSVVNIRRPGNFVVQDAPIASPDDVVTDEVTLQLDKHKEVKMVLTDKELAYSSERFIEQHVSPMAYALGNYIDQQLLALSYLVPHCQQITAASAGIAPLTKADRIMRENGVPEDGPSRRHYAASPAIWENWLGQQAFTQWQGAGGAGVATQETALIGQKFGFMPYPTNNGLDVAAQTSPTITTGLTNGAHTKGATSIAVDATTLTGTFKAGMVVQIGTAASTAGRAYNRQLYSIKADVTAVGNAATLQISPPLREDVADGVTFTLKVNAAAAAFKTDLAFHTDALALCMVPLSMDTPGVQSQVATDDNSGLSLRACRWYDANNRKNYFAMDVLFGATVLDPDMAVRGIVV